MERFTKDNEPGELPLSEVFKRLGESATRQINMLPDDQDEAFNNTVEIERDLIKGAS